MKKFNVPTQLDVILKLISGKSRKPHFRRSDGVWLASFAIDGNKKIVVRYSSYELSVWIHMNLRGKPYDAVYCGFAECHEWAKRVDANRHKWDK